MTSNEPGDEPVNENESHKARVALLRAIQAAADRSYRAVFGDFTKAREYAAAAPMIEVTRAQIVIASLVLLLGYLLTWQVARDAGIRMSDYQTMRCSDLAPGYGYRYGMYDPNGFHNCEMYGELEYERGWRNW